MEYLDLKSNDQAFDNFWYRARRDLTEIILKEYNISGKRILEVGCGAGSQLEVLLKNNEVIGWDINELAIKEAKDRGLDVCYGNVENIIEKHEKYDVVCAFDVLEHLKNDELAIKNIYEILKDDGYFIFSVPAFQFLFSAHDVFVGHYRRYSMKRIKKIIFDNNFKKVKLFYWNFFLFIPVMIARLVSKNKPPRTSIKKIPKILNIFLYGVLRAENKLIKAGFKFPLGVSIFGVFKK